MISTDRFGRFIMDKTTYDQKTVLRYILWAFIPAYIIQFIAAAVVYRVGLAQGRLVIARMMFVPALAVILSGRGLSGLGWKPGIRKNILNILAAWFLPVILTALGAGLYFLLFPSHLDASNTAFMASLGPQVMEQLAAQGLTPQTYTLISVISSVTYAPLLNMFLALGEEIGWRGFLYPRLKERFGYRKGVIFGGFIWAVWHWPLIRLIGYEYGTGYIGFPISGMLIFCIFTIAGGLLHDWLYEKSGTIWVPSLFHGSINAARTLPQVFCITGTGSAILLGPAPNGLIAVIPTAVLALIIMMRRKA